MEFLELKNDGKNDYYELKANTELYRGDDRNIDIEKYYPDSLLMMKNMQGYTVK